MKKIDSRELKKIQIEILDFVDCFCNNNNINYWLDCGTLLGAVRHDGYIPWDDDIDIGMLRKDYDKFRKLFNKNNSNKYVFKCIEDDNSFYFPFGKVLDTSTILFEPDEKNGIQLSVNIDVFVYDNAPDDEKLLKKMFKRRNLYKKLHILQLFPKSMNNNNFMYNFIRKIISLLLSIFPKGYFDKKIVINSKTYVDCKTRRVGNFMGVNKFVCDKRVFSSFVKHNFEGKDYFIPIGYDEWLTEQYGKYMTLPPKEKQISHHKFVAYYK